MYFHLGARVPTLARFRFLAAIVLACAITTSAAMAAEGPPVGRTQPPASYIVIGFVGGFVRHDNPHQSPVQLAQRIRNNSPQGTFVAVFENRHRSDAYKTVLRMLDGDHDGSLSADEKSRARIILFGHSWGASAAVMLARELDRAGIPVLLTVQVDSVHKPWQQDELIPANVAAAVNFYQPHGLVHGRPMIAAADPARTEILGNYRFDYRKDPVKCETATWFDRLTPSHAQSQCDSRLWTQVEDLVRQRLQPLPSTVAAMQQQ
jgi:hypothetical protein